MADDTVTSEPRNGPRTFEHPEVIHVLVPVAGKSAAWMVDPTAPRPERVEPTSESLPAVMAKLGNHSCRPQLEADLAHLHALSPDAGWDLVAAHLDTLPGLPAEVPSGVDPVTGEILTSGSVA